jgi:3-phenylpropionate/trans-cinnamate dioxygenase ferredoxin reductase subunit
MNRVVIIGAGQAGGWVAKTLRAEGFGGEVVLVGEEAHPPHERPPLSKAVLVGEQPAEVCHLFPADFIAGQKIAWCAETRVTGIDRGAHTLALADGTTLAYDKLVLATGGRVRKLNLPGAEHLLYLRTIEDSAALRARLLAAKHATVIGGGWIGLEVAAAARKLGVAVTVLEALPRVCTRGLPNEVGDLLAALHREHGVDLRSGCGLRGLQADGSRLRIELNDGASLVTDVAVAGIGIVPNVELARDAGLDVGDGIIVDDHGRTSDPDVFAAGDVTCHPNRLLARNVRLESWANAQNQAMAVGKALLGKSEGYAELPWFWSDQYDLNLQILGLPLDWPAPVVRGDAGARRYSNFYLRDGRIAAVIAVNAARDVNVARRLIQRNVAVSAAQLADPNVKLDALLRQAS